MRFWGGYDAAFAFLPAHSSGDRALLPGRHIERRIPRFNLSFYKQSAYVVRSMSIRICSLTVHLHLNRRRIRFPRLGNDHTVVTSCLQGNRRGRSASRRSGQTSARNPRLPPASPGQSPTTAFLPRGRGLGTDP